MTWRLIINNDRIHIYYNSHSLTLSRSTLLSLKSLSPLAPSETINALKKNQHSHATDTGRIPTSPEVAPQSASSSLHICSQFSSFSPRIFFQSASVMLSIPLPNPLQFRSIFALNFVALCVLVCVHLLNQ